MCVRSICILSFVFFLPTCGLYAQDKRPNIVWLMSEDIGMDLEFYGTPEVKTPNLNRLAQEGIRYDRCISLNPICSPNRSAMMVGVHPLAINAQHHRSNRQIPLPAQYRPITAYLREAGYMCVLGNPLVLDKGRKTDVNFKHVAVGPWNGNNSFGLFDRLDEIPTDKPFFAQIQLKVTHRGDWWDSISSITQNRIDPKKVLLPPYMPDHPVIRKDWSQYLEQVQHMDREVGWIMDELKQKGLDKNTIVIFIGDNGRDNIRGKGCLFDDGLRVPMIIWAPSRFKGGIIRDDLVKVTDISATVLSLAGIAPPPYMTGVPLKPGRRFKANKYVFSSRDAWDEILDKSRSITTKRYRYIRNYMPEVPYDAKQAYLELHRPAIHIMRGMQNEGKLDEFELQFMQPEKPQEQLFDLKNDPHELKNLAGNPKYSKLLKDFRAILEREEARYANVTTSSVNVREQEGMIVKAVAWLKENDPEAWKRIEEGGHIETEKLFSRFRKPAQKGAE